MPETDCLVGRLATLGRKLVGAWWSGSCVSGIAGILASRLAGASYVGLHRVDASRVEGFGCCCVWRGGKDAGLQPSGAMGHGRDASASCRKICLGLQSGIVAIALRHSCSACLGPNGVRFGRGRNKNRSCM